MKELTVIIPIDKMDDERKVLFDKALASVEENTPIILVGPKDELAKLNDVKGVKFVENDDPNLPKQVNVAVAEVKTKYFSVLEFDDTFTKHWFKNLEERMTANPGLFAYMPIAEVFDYGVDDKVVGYMNEPVWASSFSEILGYFDNESLMNYINVCCSGAAFDKDEFVDLGGLKESMKLSFWYELLLRANYKSKKLYVIPKIGYRHCIGRPGSLMSLYSATMPQEEADWWINLAREEQYFKKDRNKQYKK